MSIYFDIYVYTNPEATEGHNPDQIYARTEVVDPIDGITILAYLCRVNEDQYKYMVENNVDFRTWDTLPTTGTKSRIKRKIKEKDGSYRYVPTISFGGSIYNADGTTVNS